MQNNIHISTAGIALLKCYESLGPHVIGNRAFPYYDAVHKLTVGYGHLIQPGENFADGLTIPADVDKLLLKDLSKYISYVQKDLLPVTKETLIQCQIDALVLFCFNCGESSLLQSIFKNIASGDTLGAGLIIPKYCKGNFHGRSPAAPISGLTFRRYSELLLFATGEVFRINNYQELFDYALPRIRSAYEQNLHDCFLPYPENLPEMQIDLGTSKKND